MIPHVRRALLRRVPVRCAAEGHPNGDGLIKGILIRTEEGERPRSLTTLVDHRLDRRRRVLDAGVLAPIGDDHHQLVLDRTSSISAIGDFRVGPNDEAGDGIQQRRTSPWDERTSRHFGYLFQVLAVDNDLERFTRVELHEGEPRTAGLFSLLVEEGIESPNYVASDRAHRTRSVEEHRDVHRRGVVL